jgi:cysteine-rich repeat protein
MRCLPTLLLTALLVPSTAFAAVCGDGVVEAPEACDDLNLLGGDGCDGSCQVEPGWECADATFALDFAEILHTDSTSSVHVDPEWSLSADLLTVTQSRNAHPAVYVSTLPLSGVSITFELTVDEAGGDDDLIGWAIGYDAGENVSPTADWLLFDWKQGTQTWDGHERTEGLAYSRVGGPVTSYDLWDHSNAVVEVSRAQTLGATGWSDQQTYEVQLDYSVNGFDVYVDGVLEFTERAVFPTGYFSFYNFSQSDIIYTLVSPTEGSVCAELDSDGDGVSDPTELALGLDPNSPDSDGDGIDDLSEIGDLEAPADSDGDGVIDALEPDDVDTDGDGLADPLDADDDGDGVATAAELGDPLAPTDSDHDGVPDYLDPDDDGDGIATADEDTDGDGDPTGDDADGDGVPNYLDLDSDGDGLSDSDEAAGATDPFDADSDDDGLDDGTEVEVGSDPNNEDSDGDGVLDGDDGLGDDDEDGIPNVLDPTDDRVAEPGDNFNNDDSGDAAGWSAGCGCSATPGTGAGALPLLWAALLSALVAVGGRSRP